MPTVRWLVFALSLTPLPPLAAQEVFPDVEYVSGHQGYQDKIKGRLELSERELRFVGKKGTEVFAIPLGQITRITNSMETNPGSFGRKLALGIFASKKEEFVFVTWESEDATEAIVLKTKDKASPGIVTKVRFGQRRATGPMASPPADSVPPDSAPAMTLDSATSS
jgi:hypothetical protein